MAQEYITLENSSNLGTVRLNKSVFTSIALNVIEEDENVKLAETTRLRNSNTLSSEIHDNKLTTRQTFLMFAPIFNTRSLKVFLI